MQKSFTAAISAARDVVAAPRGTYAKPKAVLADALSGMNAAGQRLVLETLNPYRVFNVKKWDEPKAFASVDPSFDAFFKLLDQLADRVLTGTAARTAITAVLSQYTKQTAEYLACVIRKDLKVDTGASVFQKIYPNLGVPSFELMLCGKITDYKKHAWSFPAMAEVKYDGNRLLALVENGRVDYLTRNGLPSDLSSPEFTVELARLEAYVGEPIVVDGEALASSYQATQKSKGSAADKSALSFFAFDWMTLAEWKARSCKTPQLKRTTSLELAIQTLGLKSIVKSFYKIVNSVQEVLDLYFEVIENGAKGQDEGLIIKELDGLYEWDRSSVWLKLKPVYDVDAKIVGRFEGTRGTKNEGKLGGFIVEGEDENGDKFRSRCGGFKVSSKRFEQWFAKWSKAKKIDTSALQSEGGDMSMDQFFRQLAWDNFDELFLDETCTIEVGGLTDKNDATGLHSLRFPFFTHLRTDK